MTTATSRMTCGARARQPAHRKANKDASRLDDYVWHSNRHTFASRLAMAGVDLLTIKEIGGPTHLHAAVERLASRGSNPEVTVVYCVHDVVYRNSPTRL